MTDQQKQNKSVIEENLRSTGRKGVEALISALWELEYYSAQCVGHDRQRGGTANHSLWTLRVAQDRLKKCPELYPGVTNESLILVCLLHDIGDAKHGYYQYGGHGRRAAMILNDIGVQLSDEELAAIRFHRGHRIIDGFDEKLEPYQKTPLIRLLKHSDHVAAGVMNGVPYGFPISEAMVGHEIGSAELLYNTEERNWLWDTRGYQPDMVETRKGDIPRNGLRSVEAEAVWGINLFHFRAYDLVAIRNKDGLLGVFTVVSPTMQHGDLYRCDRGCFNYHRIVVYFNKTHLEESAHYLITEDTNSKWSVVKLTYSNAPSDHYNEFIKRSSPLPHEYFDSEKEAVTALRKMHHGIDVTNNSWFARVEYG